MTNTKIQILIYTVLFVASSLLLTAFGFTGFVYLAVMAAVGTYWLYLACRGLSARDSDAWARKMFHFSLISLVVLSVMLSIGALLP